MRLLFIPLPRDFRLLPLFFTHFLTVAFRFDTAFKMIVTAIAMSLLSCSMLTTWTSIPGLLCSGRNLQVFSASHCSPSSISKSPNNREAKRKLDYNEPIDMDEF